jgi:serine/threonine protein kinase
MQLLHYNCPIEQLGKRYTLMRYLGSGGMADVYVAWDEHDHREVAVKVIRPDTLDSSILQRFLREGKVVASLNHTHIIHIFGYGVRQETFRPPDPTSADVCEVTYIVMEYVKGGDLKKRLVRGQAYPLDKTVRIFGQLCSAVQYAHDRGVIHRDIKPGNVLFREHPLQGDQVVLSDFGLALLADDSHYSMPEAGTPAYMAPEQRDGEPEFASDIFSLGVVLHQLCTGAFPSATRPFQKPTLLNPDLPPALDKVILRALSNHPAQRYASPSLLWQAIQDAVRQTPPPRITQPQPALNPLPNRTQAANPPSVVQSSAPVPPPLVTPALEDERQHNPAPFRPQLPVNNPPTPPPISPGPIGQSQSESMGKPTTILSPSALPSVAQQTVPPKPAIKPRRTPPNRRRATLIVALIIVIALLLCGGGWAVLANNGILPMPGFAAPPPPPAAITITPASQVVQDTFVMQSAGTNADPAKREVPVRNLTSTQTDTKAVNATGHHHEDAASATGMITFTNAAANPQTVAAGTVFQVGNIQIVTDKEADIPAAASVTQPGQTKVPAHAVQPGPAGNIAALAINVFPCCGSPSIQAQNLNAFTGGKNTVDYAFLSQDDVNKVTNDNQGAVKGKAQNDIKAQTKAGEQFLGDLNCTNVASTADKPVGDQGVSVPSANVTVKVTCEAQVYDANAVKAITQNELQQGVNKNPALGPQYVLAGNIVTGSPLALQVQEDPKITSFLVVASGLWYYKWTDAMKNDLRNKVKGLKPDDAQTIVNGYQGVDKAKHPKIEINNGGNTFPSDPNQITVTVNVPNGLSEGNTQAPTPIPTSSTPANSAPTPTNPFNMPK